MGIEIEGIYILMRERREICNIYRGTSEREEREGIARESRERVKRDREDCYSEYICRVNMERGNI